MNWANEQSRNSLSYECNSNIIKYSILQNSNPNQSQVSLLEADMGDTFINRRVQLRLQRSVWGFTVCVFAGLNMTNQAREFNEMVPLTGLVLTKLDGTARGGAVVGVVDELKIPIKFIGVGETVEDLQPFNADSFVEGLFPEAA